ncbi:dmX-like protein 1 isoform X12 [Pipistrellus kuhlii]|uniref:dmX-like protein 1 isoform X12 n=1 Tax=Pipistrellus kuhlii TaxID=59472 RepID=UPI001E27159C|nr:dmX-like protein 1 isoform X12 [Pipistrellus kuhlii]
MNLHQVLTGAVNPGDHCFSVGSVGDQRFTAYASGCDIVILGSDFERLQIIPGAKHGNIQIGCVDCSMQQGKIAASYGNVISVFEPVILPKQKKNLELYRQWQKNGQFFLESIAHNITWDPAGNRLLTGSSSLQLWSNANLEKPTEDENPDKTGLNLGDWRCIWHYKTASQIHLMKFSPDGEFFATTGKDDCLLKVWYNVENWRTTVSSPDKSSEKQSQGEIDFSFVYLAHPRAVNGFSWRKTSKYMPRASVCNVLLTCCKDNVCRLWVETFLPNDCLLYGGDSKHWTEPLNLTNKFERNASSKERVQNTLDVNLRHFRRGRRRSLALVAHTGYLPHQQDPHHVHRNTPLHANALCHFHIAASINPATDIPLLPSITSLSLSENEEKSGPFVVHWLNNKELHFTLSMEVFLHQLRKSFEQPSSEASVEDSNQADAKSDEEMDDGVDDLKINHEKKELSSDKMIPNSSFVPLPSAAIDHQIEILLSEWSKNADMLFSIHPMDGSLLVWHVDWLDEYQPGMFRQVQVSFVSRIPVAFPTGDANSLCKSIVMYACTKNVDLALQQGKQKPSSLTRSTSMLISSGHNKSTNSLKLSIFTPNVMMISKHADGSLNQWLVSFAEESAFSTVLSISHKSRYCGHRFHLNDLACHSVLPLLLTTSHHNALRTPDVENQKQPHDAVNTEDLAQQNKSTGDVAFQDPNAVYSELILWRVDPVGPLSFSGGVSELARINSLHVSAFSNVAWLPTLIPSYCLGAYCNSPSACFVASDGQYLRLYEVVVDAKKLLCELSNPEISKYVGEVFNIVSQQSTARPGCIIALDPITKLQGRKTQLLHVFQEDFILNNLEKKNMGKDRILSDEGLSTSHFAWAFHSVAEEELLNMLPSMQKDNPTWSELRAMGVGWWVRNICILRKCIEKVAKAAFYRKNDPLDAAIFYLAMKKKAVIWGLYRSQKDTKMTQFFGHNFEDERWRKAALKNAFSLLGKQRFEHSAAFFLLAGCLRDAVEVCLEKLNDIQLALVIARLYESEFDKSATYKSILRKKILGILSPIDEHNSLNINMHYDPFLRSMAYWILEDYGSALETLIKQPVREDGDQVTMSACNPAVFNFYNYLRTHPLLLRRHFGSSDAFSTHVSLTGKSGLAGTIDLSERRLFFTTACAHLKAGCPMLALEVLSKIPKVIKKKKPFSRTSNFMDTSKDCSPTSPLKLDAREDKSSAIDWSQSLMNGFGSSSEGSSEKQSNSTLSFDWSQPSVVFQDDSLELKWDSDNDEENEDLPISMKERKPSKEKIGKKIDETSSNYTESLSMLDENDILSPSEDIISVQLKFRACLKILTGELRTLSTGYEIDGGKLRYQLYHWLEKEMIALQKTCNYCSDAEELQSAFGTNGDELGINEDAEDLPHEKKVKQLRENFQEKRQWLLKYQSLLRMFLSYCILHGSHGGGLASVRMELILLLQESQQDTSEPIFPSSLSEQTSVPLLFACTASAKTVVANPLLHLSNLTHDILHAIINFDSPPHPDIQSNKVYVMHTLAASLSACIYQCLCGSHNYSSFQTNQFTGMMYQTVLLPHRHSLKTGSLDEAITPNTSPAQWPGITSLIRLSNSSGEEAQSGLTILLCEILTAVYLSLFIHGLATHSSNELFRIVAHPLNEKMWSAVFGGGAHVSSKEQTHSKALPGRHFAMPSPHQVVVFSMECVGFSKALSAFSSHSPPSLAVSSLVEEGEKQNTRFRPSKVSGRESTPGTSSSPPVSQESLTVKEKFIPPELSIWDYFIAKPFLPPSLSREYDSEESVDSDDDDDDEYDVSASDFHLQEHSNSNSYSWSLMRLAMVQLVLNNLKTFYPFAGHDLAELPVSSPLCHAVLKTLQCWEQVLLRRLEVHGGPPQNYIASYTSEESLSAGPAILRHKALLEPTNTPFKSKHHLALSVKRLWQYLVKQEEIQETFIRNIFTKKRCLNESLEDNCETIKNSMMEEPNITKIEADLGYPGGKARIIHKESDIITAFAVNKANRNCIAIASSHDVQELDVSGILATQIYAWVDDDIEMETKGSEDFLVIHAHDDLTTVQGTTPYTHSNPGTPINMPWLGSTQTGRGASVMIKKAINNVRRMTSHPTLPYYLTGAQDGSVRMFEWGHSQQITCFRSGGNSRVTRMRFNYQGNKFGIVDADGYLSLYQTNWKCCPVTGSMPKPYLTWQCHNKTANDFVFISSSSLIATAGLSTDNRNICLWDTLVASANSLVHAFICHDSGATVLAYAPKHQLLISCGRKGFTCVFDLQQRQQRQLFQSHDSPVKAVAIDPTEEYFVTGSAEGSIKIWNLSTFSLLHTFISEHARQSIFRNIGTGVMQIETGPANHIFSCGADGTMKMRILPDQFSPLNEVLKHDVKFML